MNQNNKIYIQAQKVDRFLNEYQWRIANWQMKYQAEDESILPKTLKAEMSSSLNYIVRDIKKEFIKEVEEVLDELDKLYLEDMNSIMEGGE